MAERVKESLGHVPVSRVDHLIYATPNLERGIAEIEKLLGVRAAIGGTHIPVSNVAAGSRQRPDGVLLRWQFTEPSVAKTDGLIPFFIDWGSSPHPAQSTPSGATLVSLRAEHPNAGALQKQLEQLGLPLRVDPGPEPALIAVVDSPRGRVELR